MSILLRFSAKLTLPSECRGISRKDWDSEKTLGSMIRRSQRPTDKFQFSMRAGENRSVLSRNTVSTVVDRLALVRSGKEILWLREESAKLNPSPQQCCSKGL